MARYRSTRDPGFTVQHIEDRASVIFWRRTLAERNARVDPIRKMALDSFCDEYQAELSKDQAKGGREFWHDCSVGSVDCRGVLSDSEADFAMVLIRWSGNLHQALKNGSVEDLDRWTRINTLMVLRRQTGVASNLDRTVTSAHCPSCGAPESDVASHACEFCNEVINDGRFDWVLDQWLPIHSAQALKWLERLKLTNAATDTATPAVHEASVANALDWVVQTVVADGVISDEENRAILQLAARQGLTSHQAQSLVTQAVKQELDPPIPTSGRQGRQWLTMVADVAVADGTVDDTEMNVLLDLGQHIGMARYDVKLLLAKSQARQRREA
jgi:tellurite resistance protein